MKSFSPSSRRFSSCSPTRRPRGGCLRRAEGGTRGPLPSMGERGLRREKKPPRAYLPRATAPRPIGEPCA